MKELEYIKMNIKGEKPKNNYEIIRVRNIFNAKEVLKNFKDSLIVYLNNKSLNYEDKKWETILPQGIVSKIKQLNKEDFSNDDLLDDINMSIYCFKDLKKWDWYSSIEVENGFDIVIIGKFNVYHFINFIHCQNVSLKNIRIINEDKNIEYELKTIKDYTTYKKLI